MTSPSSLVRRAKDFVKSRPTLYRFAARVHRNLSPSWWAEEGFRKRCYRRFRSNPRLTITVGDQECHFEAISPKNYWHLSTSNGERHTYFNQYLLPGDVVLDIGGHVGAWTIPYSKHVGAAGRVYVFEPDPQGFAAIQRNVALNDCSNVTAFNWAISDVNESTRFFIRPNKDTHSLFRTTSAPSPSGVQTETEIEVHTIDRLLETGIILQPNFIKLDIEGAELLALEGMRKALQRTRAVYVECHDEMRVYLGHVNPVQLVTEKLAELGAREVIRLDDTHVLGVM